MEFYKAVVLFCCSVVENIYIIWDVDVYVGGWFGFQPLSATNELFSVGTKSQSELATTLFGPFNKLEY